MNDMTHDHASFRSMIDGTQEDWDIIAREQISVCCDSRGWLAHKGYGLWQSYLATGDNALQAAMRCYVISRFGDTYSGDNPEGK